jgi:Ca2+-binding EF-hand superfamily protein
MKRLTLATGAALCAVVLTGGAALAESRKGAGVLEFEQIDADGNGEISRHEMMDMRARRLADADSDGDGAVSLEELENQAAARARERAGKMMTAMDANGDGALSADEMMAGHQAGRHFERVDQDGDGVISKAEFDARHEHMGRHRGMSD